MAGNFLAYSQEKEESSR